MRLIEVQRTDARVVATLDGTPIPMPMFPGDAAAAPPLSPPAASGWEPMGGSSTP